MDTNTTPNPNEEAPSTPAPQQPPAQEPFVPQGEKQSVPAPTQTIPEYDDSGWTWGGFALNWMFIIAIREYAYLFLLLLMLIPFLNFLVFIGFAIYLGINGREMARKSKTFANNEQYLGFMKGLDHAGKIVFYFYAAIFAFAFFAAILMFSSGNVNYRYDIEDETYIMQEGMMETEKPIQEDRYNFR